MIGVGIAGGAVAIDEAEVVQHLVFGPFALDSCALSSKARESSRAL